MKSAFFVAHRKRQWNTDLTPQIHARPVLRLKAEKEEGHAQEEVSPRRDYHQAA
jgi:hypothetical protein